MPLWMGRSRRRGAGRFQWQRFLVAALPLMAVALLLAPDDLTNRVRVWASPVFAPFQNATEDYALNIGERIRRPTLAPNANEAALAAQVRADENALAEMAARLGDCDRQVRDLARIRQDLNGLPCRLVPARLLAPEISGGRAGARLSAGADKGVRRPGAVIAAHIDRGAREALQRGEPVLTAAGLVGLVEEVGPVTSTVRLVTDPRTSLLVQIITRRNGQWRAGPEGIARGTEDGQSLTVQGVPRESDVAAGDFVVTSPSPESPLPPYLIVGRVVKSELKPAGLFRDLVVEPRAVPAEVRDVYVLSLEIQPPVSGK